MRRPYEDEFPDDLHGVAARLRNERIDVDDLELDQLKQRALARSRPRPRRSLPMVRVTAMITAFVLTALSGGALAISRFDSHPNIHGGAASDQYRPPKGCGHRAGNESKCEGRGPKHKSSVSGAFTTQGGSTRANGAVEAAGTPSTPTTGSTPTTNGTTQAAQGTLPFTGQDVLTLVLVGLLLAGGGLLLLQTLGRRGQGQ